MKQLKGSITKRKDGYYKVKLGSRQKVCRTETDAKRILREFKNQYDPSLIEYKRQTIRVGMEEWLNNVLKHSLKPMSYDRKECTLHNQVYPYIGDCQVGSLNHKQIENMISDQLDSGVSYSTVKKALEAVRGFYQYLINNRQISINPAAGIKLPAAKKSTKEISFYTEEELQRIYQSAVSTYSNGVQIYRLGQVIKLLANTGLRVGELLGLRWCDVDMDNKTLTVRGNRVTVIQRGADGSRKYVSIYQPSPKTKSGTRTIPLNKNAMECLTYLQEINGKFENVCATKNGQPVSPRNIDRMFRNVATKAGIEPERIYGVHSLRHSFASMLIAKGVDIKKVSNLLGHKDVYITYDIYVHLLPKDYSDAVALLD